MVKLMNKMINMVSVEQLVQVVVSLKESGLTELSKGGEEKYNLMEAITKEIILMDKRMGRDLTTMLTPTKY